MIRYAVHRARRRIDRMLYPGGRGALLLYHRVADEVSDPYGLCVSPAQFEEHVQVVRELGRLMRLADFADALRTRSLPEKAICLTFDDGYADNMLTAEPILAKHDMTALVFVTTGAGGRTREFWWDELERVFLQPGELPETLQIEIGGQSREFVIGADSRYTTVQQQQYRAWRLFDDDPPSARHAVFRKVYDLVQPLATAERIRALDALLDWSGQRADIVRAERSALQPEQVAQLVQRRVMDVGAHTVNHPALPTQPVAVQRAELRQSKHELEEWTGATVHGFAYPYGHYDDTTVAAARDAGFTFACSGVYRPVTPRADMFLLPRIEAPAVDGDELGRILRWQLQ